MSLAISTSYPTISPYTIAAGAVYTHATSFILSRPVFGALFHKAKSATNAEEVVKSDEAASAAALYGSSLVSSVFQSYGVASILKLTGVTSYKAASIVGSLLFAVTTGPALVSGFLIKKEPLDALLSQTVVSLLDTVGLALTLTWASSNPVLDGTKLQDQQK